MDVAVGGRGVTVDGNGVAEAGGGLALLQAARVRMNARLRLIILFIICFFL
jgi:hypothetical protein